MNITNIFRKYDTGIVFSGGAVRGFAHLGVIKALHEAGVKPDVISGVSAGSIVGAFYADGYEPDEILDIFEQKKFYDLVSVLFKNSGLLDIGGLKKLLKNNLRAKSFDELKKPLYVTLTNLETGGAEYFKKGNIVDIVLASSSIPVLFKPRKINKRIYVDGGLVNNLPTEPIVKECKKLIGVNVNPLEENPKLDGLRNIAIRSFQISIASSVNIKKDTFDVYIEPQELRKYGYFSVSESRDLFKIGYEATRNALGN
ncbi:MULTISPECIES: patatin-like phospholipase family protein [unclassified Saccharicrinis]|uniref:patatin-like phospholipase family protein n=1 Tax=unclassified Saccharicrinis TaxID=2646859 RepID=UPI003D3520CB